MEIFGYMSIGFIILCLLYFKWSLCSIDKSMIFNQCGNGCYGLKFTNNNDDKCSNNDDDNNKD